MFHKSWMTFIREIEAVKQSLGFRKNEEIFYRGHTHHTHELMPGLFRNLENGFSKQSLWNHESDMFYEFRARAKEVHNGNLCDWDVLFYMQHHGMQTRLLDWSESFGVALYFALLDYKRGTSSPHIWVLNPYKLNEKYHNSRDLYAPENLDYTKNGQTYSYSDFLLYVQPSAGIWWKEPIAIYPIRRVDRLTTQGGYFTVHGTINKSLEKISSQRENICRRVEIPPEAIESAFLFLEQSGINHFTMFPDLDGLARYLNKKYLQ